MRPHVNGVCFDFAKGVAAATDGYRLVRCIIEGAEHLDAGRFLLRRDTVASIAKQMKRHDLAIIDAKNTKIDGSSWSHAPVEATFPPYEQVIPKFNTANAGVPFAVDARFLAAVALQTEADALRIGHGVNRDAKTKRFEDDKAAAIACFPPETSLDPIAFQTMDASWLVVLMPRRASFGAGDEFVASLSACTNFTRRKGAA
jgi:hypothetical protein